jgi:undecaprenyl diphosphate synthase
MQRALHIAIIMDGNGRWAQQRGLPRLVGHHAGERALRRVVEAAAGMDVSTLTVYAFSSDNWKRPADEVNGLFLLLQNYLAKSVELARAKGVRIAVIGRRDRLPAAALEAIEYAERETQNESRLHFRIAIDYSSRDALLSAFRAITRPPDRENVAAFLGGHDVDLLIRTGGEQRLSDFLLWECAYAELFFTPCLWPDFGPDELRAAIAEFRKRERRFGALPSQVSRTSAIEGVL